jgi:hypothetical protein
MILGGFSILAAVALVGAGLVHRALLSPPDDRWPAPVWPPIGRIQRAGSGQEMVGIMEQLGPQGRFRLRNALWVDVVIVAGYTTLLVCGALASRHVVRSALLDEDHQSVGVAMAVGAVVVTCLAAALDLVENLSLGLVVHGWPDQLEAARGQDLQRRRFETAERARTPTAIARLVTTTKWVFLSLVLLWLAVTAVVALAQVDR